MHPANCLNCEKTLQGDEKYCPACGQKTDTHRFTWAHFFHEAWHAITHTDKGLLNLLKGLATQPGKVVSEYVDGKHKKYFNPITFSLLCIGLFVLVNNTIKPFGEPQKVDEAILAQLPTEAQKKQYIQTMDRLAVGFKWQEKHSNILSMIGLPIETFFLWLFFRKRGRNFVELMIAVIFLGGFGQVIFTLFISPPLSLLKGKPIYPWLAFAGFLVMASYLAWGIKGFLANPKSPAYWKVWLVELLYYVFWSAFVVLFFMWFVFRERTGIVLKKTFNELLGQ